jgi:CTP:molybdopterin cytidylyltransferase MocA
MPNHHGNNDWLFPNHRTYHQSLEPEDHHFRCYSSHPIMPRPNTEIIIPIILAAGPSPSLPFPKALAPFGQKTALAIAIENCTPINQPVVVLGSDADKILPHVPKSAKIVVNDHWPQGQLSSLQAALNEIPVAAFLIYPVDHALLKPETIRQLLQAFHTRSATQEIVMPRHNSSFGHPVIVSPTLRPEFFQAKTAREVIYRHPNRIRAVEVTTPTIYQDFNSEDTYELCLQQFMQSDDESL